MPSWNKRFFLPSLLLTCIVLSGAVLAQPQAQIEEEVVEVVYLPQIADRVAQVEVTEKVESNTQETETEASNQEMVPIEAPLVTTSPQTSTLVSSYATETTTTEVTSPEPVTQLTPAQEEPVEVQPTSIQVSLSIKGPGISKSGKISIEPGSTVLQVLKKGSSQLDFSLKTSHHSSLGVFVEGIAGITNNPKANVYWLYYVNGQFASRGVSLQTVQEGDTITWSYE